MFYPLPSAIPYRAAISSTLVLGGVSCVAFRYRRQYPWMIFGWLWFLGTLIPVAGFVQVGAQAVADRYSYISSIGLFLIFALALACWVEVKPVLRPWITGTSVALLLLCTSAAYRQLTTWKNGVALFTRELKVCGNSAFAQDSLGVALANEGKDQDAISHYLEAVRLQPDSVFAHFNLGVEYANLGDLKQAAYHFFEALKQTPRDAMLRNNLGVMLAQEGDLKGAMEQFETAIHCNPSYGRSYFNYATALETDGQTGLAIKNYRLAIERDPDSPEILNKLALLLATSKVPEFRDPSEAIRLSQRANAMTSYRVALYVETLSMAFAAAKDYPQAISNSEAAQRLAKAQGMPDLDTKIEHDLKAYHAREAQMASVKSDSF